MENKKNVKLRESAEEKFLKNPKEINKLTLLEIGNMLHELRVHQIELEMQNEQLRAAQIELDESREKYFELYNLAPIGYLTIDSKGIIEEANLTAANQFGVDRFLLIKRPLTKFILKEDQDIFYLQRKKLIETNGSLQFDIRMHGKGGSIFWANVTAVISAHIDGAPFIKVIISDISERKQMAQALQKAMDEIHTLHGIIPICANCKKIRDDQGFWNQVETYISSHSEAKFSHGLCPECLNEFYSDFKQDDGSKDNKKG